MWVLFSLGAALCAAIVVVLSKAGITKLDPVLVFGIEALCIVAVSWTIILIKGVHKELRNIEGRVWQYILIAGVLTAASSLLSFQSLKLGHASRTSSFEKISLIFSILLATVFLKDKLTWQLIFGAVLMITGVLFIAFSDAGK